MKDIEKAPQIAASQGAAFETGAAVVARPERGILRLAGKDPVGMLNAILTNDVPQGPDRGAYALLLNPKGRVQADLRVLKDGETILVDTEPEGAEAARGILGRYAPFSRVKLEDLSETWSVLGLYGPDAQGLLDNLELVEHQTVRANVGGISILAVGVAVPVPGYDLILPAETLAQVRDHLIEAGAIPAENDAYETARVEAGVLDRAVSFQKGCYPGQETVARMHHRGHPNKTLHRLVVEGNAPAVGDPISQGDKLIGGITSVVPFHADDATTVLGYLSRKTDPDAPLVAGGSAVSVLGEIS